MPLEFNTLRMAIDEYRLEPMSDDERAEKRQAVLRLVSVGLLVNLIAAYDDATERLAQCES